MANLEWKTSKEQLLLPEVWTNETVEEIVTLVMLCF